VKALIVADGRVPPRSALPTDLLGDVDLVVAADGGAERAALLGLRPDLVVGDADSIDADALRGLAASGTPVERFPTEKDESDLELALMAALGRDRKSVV
jgi:thiamine pyrophosphokinase